MRLVKPNWVTHDGSPIFSVDIHPDGYRFATGGQGGDSGRVVIWNMEPVLNEKAESDPDIPKMLCQLDHHLACVNCVRWNSQGQLASGGDDKIIMIWKFERRGGPKSIFQPNNNVETWRCIAPLRAHSGDILDLAWSPNSQWLASASVDNTIIVWNVELKTILTVLRGHTGLVKGVTWDPIGKYLASQSDDKTLRVWRTDEWSEEAVITDPFEECGGTTHVLRLSWSPDGQYLVSAHAMNGGGPTAQIVERGAWKTDKDYVGHRKAVTCVRFNGRILQKLSKAEKKPVQYCCVAIGSRDRSVSVWSTSLKRPVVVINELFVASVVDLSWSPCGMQLCACSKDGTVVFIEFSEEELGQPVDASMVTQIKQKLYGQIHDSMFRIIEVPEFLKQTEASPQKEATAQASPPKSTAQPEPMEMGPPAQPSQNNMAKPTSVNTSSVQGSVHKQIETKTTDGKRRITPMFLATPSGPTDSEPGKPGPVASTSFSNTTSKKSSIVVEKRDDVVQPNVGPNATAGSNKSSETTSAPPITSKLIDDIVPPEIKDSSEPKKPKVAMERSGSEILIPPLKPVSNFNMIAGHFAVTIKLDKTLYRMEVFDIDRKLLWDQYLGYSATGLATTTTLIAVSLEDGTMHIFNTAKGIRLSPPFVPKSPIAKMHAAGSRVMIISSYGDVQVWEVTMNLCKQVFSTSAAHLIVSGSGLLHSSLLNGLPCLIFKNARAYVFQPEMGSWLLIGDSQDPILRFAMLNAPSHLTGLSPMGPLARIQEALNRHYGISVPMISQPQGPMSMVAYMEQMTMASKVLGSSTEYNYWILASINLLSSHERFERRLRNILDDLLGPVHDSAHLSKSWDPVILGLKKHELLEDALKIVAKELRWQRLYVEYNDQLKMLKDLYNKNSSE
ncbi:hypothetical protein QAD02_004810 [Eretmocerus hayati]|uniref:Uncharacterized protein n=1 Tax=Eretmocerus hayati TaxID=131215 RepID=A0ACC2NRT1_9HYME|nr:hypothetical protein QAD02_004810 [Eretmocerus hayati]